MNNKILNLILITLIFSYFAAAQSNKVILNEEFNDNSNNWNIYDKPEANIQIINGNFNMQGKMLGKAIISTISSLIDTTIDYRIEAEITKITGIDDNGFGLVWGCLDANNELEFVISGNGQFKITQWQKGLKTELIPWTYFSGIKRWDSSTNRLRIEKHGNITKFYINDYYVARTKAPKIMDNKVGFIINENMQISANYLHIEKIKKEPENNQLLSPNIKIISAEFDNQDELLEYQKSIILKVIIKNLSNFDVHDIALMIGSFNDENISYNSITMIEKLAANNQIITSVIFTADENIQNSERNFVLNLADSKNNILDSKMIKIRTKQNQFYNNYQNGNNYQTGNHPDNDIDGCTKGCAYLSFATLIVGIIISIL